jgi:hypothetical protein
LDIQVIVGTKCAFPKLKWQILKASIHAFSITYLRFEMNVTNKLANSKTRINKYSVKIRTSYYFQVQEHFNNNKQTCETGEPQVIVIYYHKFRIFTGKHKSEKESANNNFKETDKDLYIRHTRENMVITNPKKRTSFCDW